MTEGIVHSHLLTIFHFSSLVAHVLQSEQRSYKVALEWEEIGKQDALNQANGQLGWKPLPKVHIVGFVVINDYY